jgi:DNA-binding NtrC family response regulator
MIRKPVLLVVDDEPGMLSVLERFAAPLGFFVITDGGGRNALDRIRETAPDVALVDLHMPDIGGLDVLRAIRLAQPECRVILMTGQADVDSAIEAVKIGAMDYLSKPLDLNRLRGLLTQVENDLRLRAEVLSSERHTAQQMELCGMIGRSPVMQELFGLVRRLAPHARTALVMGETGAGKEGIARAIHRMGPRKSRPFVTVNCSAVVETLFESELFGHARGAFTGATEHKAGLFEVADGGTIFLDEIGELPLAVQAKLLRVLETGEVQRVGSLQPKKVDVRIVAATNRDLRAAAAAGTFRNDLYFRLNVVELQVPPLRDRRQDIPYLTAAFVREFAGRFGKSVEGVSAAAERVLMESPWPGNVRELRNVLERACMLADGRWLAAGDVARGGGDARSSGVVPSPRPHEAPVPQDLSSLTRSHIVKVLEEERGNKRSAAAKLGVSRRTLYRMLERHRLPLNPFDVAATA